MLQTRSIWANHDSQEMIWLNCECHFYINARHIWDNQKCFRQNVFSFIQQCFEINSSLYPNKTNFVLFQKEKCFYLDKDQNNVMIAYD